MSEEEGLAEENEPEIVEQELIKLDIGSGEHPRARRDGYLHVDLDPHAAWLDVHADALALPYENNTVAEIQASHIIEHLRPPQVIPFLSELRRVLTRGAWLWIYTPHLANVAQAMEEVGVGYWNDIQALIFGREDDEMGGLNVHHCMFNFRVLAKMLHMAQFVDIRDMTRNHRDLHDEGWSEALGGRHMSLKVMARKP